VLHYLARRIVSTLPILLGVALVFFLVFNLVGGSERFLYNILPPKGRTPETIGQYREAYGLDRPLIVQFLDTVGDMVTFDFGRSESTRQQVSYLIARYVPASAALAVPAFVVEIALALALAMLCARTRGRWPDRLVGVLSVAGMSLPMLALVIIGQRFLAFEAGLFPISGWARGLGAVRYLALPWLLWVTVAVGYDVRFFRTALVEEQGKEYVRAAMAKGMPRRLAMRRHVLRNAMVPILTYVVIQVPFLLTGSMLLERFFSIPGIGELLVQAILSYDLPVMKATVTFYTLFFIGFSVLTDLLYAAVDPRVRLG
jgi:peptide/nickel transport system permease protein